MKSMKVSMFVDRLQALPKDRKEFVNATYKWLDKEMVMVVLENRWNLRNIEEVLPLLDNNGYVVVKDKGKYFLRQGQSIT